MKLQNVLNEIYNVEPRYAWFETAMNSKGMKGVRLAFVEPSMPRFDAQLDDARKKHDKGREERVSLKKNNYEKQGQRTFPRAPDLGWWLNTEDFEAGQNNESGLTKGNIYKKYPQLEIFPTRAKAEKAAESAGLI